MILLSTKRVLKFSWQHFWRNVWLSVATIFIIVLTLFSITTLILVNVITDKAVESVKKSVDVSLYFDNQITSEAIELLQGELNKIDEISSIEYIAADAALKKFKQDHQGDEDILATIDELDKNPLGGTLILKANKSEDYPVIMAKIQSIEALELVETVDYEDHQMLIERINNIADKIEKFGLGLTLMFILIALLTVFNTVRMAIYVHRKEIAIMRLVGANNWFIRMPFIVEGVLYALFGCIIFWGIIFLLLNFIAPWVNSFFTGIDFNMVEYLVNNVLYLFGFEFIIIALINVISSFIAMAKYLRI